MTTSNSINLLPFLIETGKLGNIKRKIHNIDSSEPESVASHTYHMVLLAILLLENKVSNEELIKIIKLILIHDLGEIGAEDVAFNKHTPEHSTKERDSYISLISLLPNNLQGEYINLWNEYKEVNTIEAKYAKAIDKLQAQIVCYSHLLNHTEDEYIPLNVCKRDEAEELIWKYIEDVFPEWAFIKDTILDSLDKLNSK